MSENSEPRIMTKFKLCGCSCEKHPTLDITAEAKLDNPLLEAIWESLRRVDLRLRNIETAEVIFQNLIAQFHDQENERLYKQIQKLAQTLRLRREQDKLLIQ